MGEQQLQSTAAASQAPLVFEALGYDDLLGGVTLPAFSVSSFWVFERSYSILGGIVSMAKNVGIVLSIVL